MILYVRHPTDSWLTGMRVSLTKNLSQIPKSAGDVTQCYRVCKAMASTFNTKREKLHKEKKIQFEMPVDIGVCADSLLITQTSV